MDEVEASRYWCYRCSQVVNPVMEIDIKCPFCEGGFIVEMDDIRGDQETDLGSDRAISLWAPILLSMLGGGGGGGGDGRRRQTSRREVESEEDDEEAQREEAELEANLESLLRRRRRRSSAAIMHLLHGLQAGAMSESDNTQNEREREQQDREREGVILINPFNQAIILQGSFGLNQNQNQSIPGSLGDYLIGPGLDLLLQHLAENDPNRYGTPPAKKEAVEAMPTVKIEKNLQCSVCLEDFEIGTEAKEMPCNHKFHNGCILPWLELHSSCPVCRFQIPASEDGPKSEADGLSGIVNNRVVENSVGDRGGVGGDDNGRSSWLPIPWPFNGLFSLSGSQNGGNSPSPPSSSSAAGPTNTNHRDEN